jgi:hypothetical protein
MIATITIGKAKAMRRRRKTPDRSERKSKERGKKSRRNL